METIEKLKEFIFGELVSDYDPNKLGENVSLLEEGILDSLGIMKIIPFIEESFNVKIIDEEIIPENFETLSSIASFISKKKGIA